MRRTQLFAATVAVLVGVCFLASRAVSQEQPAAEKKSPANGMDDAMMKAFAEAGAVGQHHKALEAMAGNFTFVNKFKMDPSQEWQTCEGTYEGEMGMGGRYLLSTVKGDMMGMTFDGMGCMGYDNTLKKHVAAWIDSMGTGIMRSEGTCDSSCKTITFTGDMMCPIEHTMKQYKYQYEIKSNDEFVMRWWSPSMTDGKMFESMVITYTRVK